MKKKFKTICINDDNVYNTQHGVVGIPDSDTQWCIKGNEYWCKLNEHITRDNVKCNYYVVYNRDGNLLKSYYTNEYVDYPYTPQLNDSIKFENFFLNQAQLRQHKLCKLLEE